MIQFKDQLIPANFFLQFSSSDSASLHRTRVDNGPSVLCDHLARFVVGTWTTSNYYDTHHVSELRVWIPTYRQLAGKHVI